MDEDVQKEVQKERVAKARKSIQDERIKQSRFQPSEPGLEVASSCAITRRQKYQYVTRPFVESNLFEISAGCVIVYSTVTMALEVDQVNVPFLINFSESFLTSFFLFEWSVRLSVYGWEWLTVFENLLDTFIVWIPGVLTVWFLQPLFSDSSGFLKTVRIIRMLRLLRLVKVFRNLPMMQDLWMLVRGLLKSGSTLGSALVLIVFTLYVFGIAAVDLIGRADYSNAVEDSQTAQSRFFGLWNAMLTLTRFMHADDAQGIMDELMLQQPYIWIFLWMFTACSSFVLLNLVTAIICNEAFETSKCDEADMAKQLMLQREQELKEFQEMFLELDEDGSGQVTLDEFQNAFSIDNIRNKLTIMGLTEDTLLQLFMLLDTDGEGELDLEEFMGGMQALSGLATAKDMVILTKGMERIEKQVASVMEGSLAHGVPTQDMLQNQMTQFRVDMDSRFRKTHGPLKDLAQALEKLKACTLPEEEAEAVKETQ
ncbi:unnamed protein product [Effrenium voratum]|nr:unnamed protein product [Effrenium voratum]